MGSLGVLQLLLRNGADINAKCSGKYSTALQAACVKGNVAVVRLLLESGADPGGWYGNALQIAVKFHHGEVAKLMLERGVESKATGGLFTDVFEAANGNKDMTRLWIDIIQ